MRRWLADNWLGLALLVLLGGAVCLALHAQAPTINPYSQLRLPTYNTWATAGDPNTRIPCNVQPAQGVPYPRPYDIAIETGVMGVSGDQAFLCLNGTHGPTWVALVSAP